MNDQKAYSVPNDTKVYMFKAAAFLQLEDKFIALGDYGNASRCAIDRVTNQQLFWDEIFSFYPELREEKCEYNFKFNRIDIKKEENNSDGK